MLLVRLAAGAERAWADVNSAFALTSAEQIEDTLAIADHTLREPRKLIAERPADTVVVWENGLTAWRKVAYYTEGVRIFVLEHKRICGGSPVVAVWRRSQLVARQEGPAPLRVKLPPRSWVIWLLDPRSRFPDLVRQDFDVGGEGPALFTDLPAEPGCRKLGEYEIA